MPASEPFSVFCKLESADEGWTRILLVSAAFFTLFPFISLLLIIERFSQMTKQMEHPSTLFHSSCLFLCLATSVEVPQYSSSSIVQGTLKSSNARLHWGIVEGRTLVMKYNQAEFVFGPLLRPPDSCKGQHPLGLLIPSN